MPNSHSESASPRAGQLRGDDSVCCSGCPRLAPASFSPHPEEVVFVVRGSDHVARVPRQHISAEVSPVLDAMLAGTAKSPSDDGFRCEQDALGRYVLDGPSNFQAFNILMECLQKGHAIDVRKGHALERDIQERQLELNARVEACRYADYLLLGGPARVALTKALLGAFIGNNSLQEIDAMKLGLCQSEMIMDLVHVEGISLKGLNLSNSHVRNFYFKNCTISDSEFHMSVSASDVRAIRCRMQSVKLGVFAPKLSIEDGSVLQSCNLRVVEELNVSDSTIKESTFQGSEEDRKDRQMISAAFRRATLLGDLSMPFDKLSCEQTSFDANVVRMTKSSGASVRFAKTRTRTLPRIESEGRVSLTLEDCDLLEPIVFSDMQLILKRVHLAKPCEIREVEFPDKVTDITFPKGSKFRQVRFRSGLQGCMATGCTFDDCNFGFQQDAVAFCLLTDCHFTGCHFPFLEADSPVSNFSGSHFVRCRIQWSGQFPHEECFVIKSFWLRNWNLAGSTVSETPA